MHRKRWFFESLLVLSFFMSVPVLGAVLRVSPDGNGVEPYATWADAAPDIQTAVDYASAGDTIQVTNGTYSIESTGYIVSIDKGITLESVNGPDVTLIDALAGTTSTDRHSLYLNAGDALVRGFTMQGMYYRTTSTGNSAVQILAGTVSNCVIRANWTIGGVGGVYISGGLLVDSEIRENTSTEWQNGRGGGIHMTGGTVERCRIVENNTSCWRGGAGVYMTGGTLRNSIVDGNINNYFREGYDPETIHGGAAGVYLGNGAIENCTITGNDCNGRGAGIYAEGGSVWNSIVYGNTSRYRWPIDEWNLYGSATVRYSCVPFLAGGEGNVTNDPAFHDATGGDYRLLPGSSCIDAGTNIASFAEDIERSPRPIGDAWDIGAYETTLPGDQPFTCNFTATPTEGVTSLDVEFSSHFAGANTNITWYRWQFGDGQEQSGSSLGTVSHVYSPGRYDVTLTASNSVNEQAVLSKAAYIVVNPTVLYVSTNGTHTIPFDTPAKAAHDIASAVEAAPPYDHAVVEVDAGTWEMAGQVEIEKALTVRSVNGPTNTTTIVPGQQRSFYLFHPDAVVDGFTMTTSGNGNHYMNGAGVYMLQGTVTNCIIRDIVVGGRGAAIWMAGGRVVDCYIHDNRTYEWQYGYGGGIYIESYSHYGEALVENCRIERNECQSLRGGGGVYMQRGTLRNSLVVSNSATYNVPDKGYGTGGGVRMQGGVLENCTVTRNFSVQSGGGVYMGDVSTELVNTIVYDNTVELAVEGERNLYNIGGPINYSCIAPFPAGTGNTDSNPLFRDPDALDFGLQTASPCVDSGLYADWMEGAVDLNGDPRIINGTVDMGCFEAPDPWDGPLVSGFSADPTSGFLEMETVFTAEPVGANTNIVTYTWTFGDGNSVSGADKAVVTNTYSAGYYDVTLEVENDDAEVSSITRSNYIKVAPGVAYVATNSTPVPPYLSWETAANTLQDALNIMGWDAMSNHTVIDLGPGTYSIGAELILTTNTTLRGVAGNPADVVLQGVGTSSRVLTLSHPGITLSGLTVAGGYNPYHLYHGGGIYMSAGTVTNCLIRDNLAGGQGGGIHLAGGLVTHTTFRNNIANEWNYGYGGGLFISDGLVENCVFDANECNSKYGGGGIYQNGGTVRNCLLMRNAGTQTYSGKESPGGGIRIAKGVFESSTVVSNTAILNGGGIYQTGGTVRNVISYGNAVTISGAVDWHNPLATVTHCLSPDLVHDPEGTGNRTTPPVFVDAAAFDFRLDRGSPGLDAGVNQDWMDGGIDLDGNPRIAIGLWPRVVPEDTVDIGAYELSLPPQGTLIRLQ